MKCGHSGPLDADIMIVGEAPGAEEERRGLPFVGNSGEELTRMLHDAGIPRERCYLTNVAKHRPPGNDIGHFFLDKKQKKPGPQILEGLNELVQEISIVKPNVVIALGNVPLWAFTTHRGITSWRGSVLSAQPPFPPVKVVPTYHPAGVLRQWDWRFIAVQDLRRALRESESPSLRYPNYQFILRPSFEATIRCLDDLISRASHEQIRLAGDLETRRSHIACLGIAWTPLDAICIPFMCVERPTGYWSPAEEFEIVTRVRTLFTHPNVELIGQNFLYDLQYIARYWGFAPKVKLDTMLAQHCAWPGLPKGLDFISSMYCEFHRYWKDDGKDWAPGVPEEQLWNYNCIDCVTTLESSFALDTVLTKLGLRSQFDFQMEVFHTIFRVMLRGVAVDKTLRNSLAMELLSFIQLRHEKIKLLSGRTFLGPKGGFSPKQLSGYFYDTLGLQEQKSRKTGKRTCDEDALVVLARREPLIRRLVYSIVEARSLASSLNVVRTPLDVDGRSRCSYNPAGTVTFRFSSSENAFGSGTNLQNVTAGGKSEETGLILPNLRRLFVPDQGKLIVDVDLDRADLQVVVWEADDADLKRQLRAGVDVHIMNGVQVKLNKDLPEDELIPSHREYPEHRMRYAKERQFGKVFVHATDYFGKPPTVAAALGESVHQIQLYQRRWLGRHPGIPKWWDRVRHSLATKREVRNAFGNRIFFFDRIESLLPEALAWIPQSTIALVINRAMVALDKNIHEAEILLQVHDSLDFQIPRYNHPQLLSRIRPHLLITIPYPDPLIIPVGFKISDKSWGDCEETKVN